MGLIRGGIVFFLGVLLFLAFLMMNTFATISSSLSHDNVKAGIYPVLSGTTEDSDLPADILGNLNLTKVAQGEQGKILSLCRTQGNQSYGFTYEGFQVNVPCDVAAQGSEAIRNETINDVVDGIYYKQYECDFWNCFSNNEFPFFLISQKAHDYWQGKFWLALLVSLVLAALIILLMNERINAPILLGILLALSSIPILKMGSIISFVAGEPISYIIEIFFGSASKIFWISFIIAILLVCLGIALKVMNLGFIKKLVEGKPDEKQTTQPQQPAKPRQQKKRKK